MEDIKKARRKSKDDGGGIIILLLFIFLDFLADFKLGPMVFGKFRCKLGKQ